MSDPMISLIDSNQNQPICSAIKRCQCGWAVIANGERRPTHVLSIFGQYFHVLMVIGLGSAMVGIYFANRWVRKPRPEEQIDRALKGLGDTYAVCHYPKLPVDHILVTPTAIIVMETIAYQGMFVYKEGKWKENMTIGRAIRYIVEEHLGDPTRTVLSEVDYLKEKLKQEGLPEISVRGLVLFTHPAAIVEVKNPPVPVCRIDKLRKTIDHPGSKNFARDYGTNCPLFSNHKQPRFTLITGLNQPYFRSDRHLTRVIKPISLVPLVRARICFRRD